MKHNLIPVVILLSLMVSCAPQNPNPPKPTETPLVIPTRMSFPTRISPTSFAATSTAVPGLLDDVKFVTVFSNARTDWQVIPGNVTPAQLNDAVAEQEGDEMRRVNQKVMNGFLRVVTTQVGGQVFEILTPAEVINGKLKELKVKSVGQTPVLASHGVLLEDYFAINFPDVVERWEAQGAQYEDFKYAAVITVTWATKYGPLRVSYIMSGKYISQEGVYPGRLDFLKECMYESTQPHYLPTGKLALNFFPAPIVGISGTTIRNVYGEMQSDAFGWTPMADFVKAQINVLNGIGQAVSSVPIESKETLADLQADFNRAFIPVHCAEVAIE